MPPRFHHFQRSHFFKNAFCVVLEACITDMQQGRAVHTLSLKLYLIKIAMLKVLLLTFITSVAA